MNGLKHICDKFSNHTIRNYLLVFVVPSNGQLKSRQNMLNNEGNVAFDPHKTPPIKMFEANQWLFTYHLPVPVYTFQQLPLLHP